MSDASSAAEVAAELAYYKERQARHDALISAVRSYVVILEEKDMEIADLQRQLAALQPTPQSDLSPSALTNAISETGKRNWLLPQ